MTTITAQLADALRGLLDCSKSDAWNGSMKLDDALQDSREALAAYDAQQAQKRCTGSNCDEALTWGEHDPDCALALIRDIALTEAGGNSEPDVMARTLDDIIGRCQGFIAKDKQA